jgi:hypothetical protein
MKDSESNQAVAAAAGDEVQALQDEPYAVTCKNLGGFVCAFRVKTSGAETDLSGGKGYSGYAGWTVSDLEGYGTYVLAAICSA